MLWEDILNYCRRMLKLDKRIYKFLFIGCISLALSFLLEIVYFNFNAFTKAQTLNIDASECTIQETDALYIYEYGFNEARYINKIIVKANTSENVGYNVCVKYENDFGIVEEMSIDDILLFTNQAHYTYIGKNIVNVRVTIPKTEVNVYGFCFKNEFHINQYRVLVLFAIGVVLGSILFIADVCQSKPEIMFVLIGTLMGICMILIQGTVVMGWDEEVHFNSVHEMLSTEVVENSISTQTIDLANNLVFDTWEEKSQLIQYYNVNADIKDELATSKNPIRLSDIGYVFQALFYKCANVMKCGFNQCYMAGRFGNLLFYLFVIYFAIKIAKDGKMLIACISLMPTTLYIATLYTYDSFVYAVLTLGFVCLYNEWTEEKKINKKIWIMSIVLLVVGSLPKAVYIPLVLLSLTVLTKKSEQGKVSKNKWIVVGVSLIFILVMATFVVPVLKGAITGDASIGGDPRGGETNYVWQLMTVFEHPFAYVKMIVRDVLSFDNFRNFGFEHLDNVLFSNIGLLCVGRYGVMADKYIYFLIPYIVCLFLWSRTINIQKKYRRYTYVVAGLIVTLIWTAMYMAFTPVGMSQISGVQVRYYLPLLIPLMLVIPLPKIKIENSHLNTSKKAQILFLGVWFFLSYCVYFLMFKSACI